MIESDILLVYPWDTLPQSFWNGAESPPPRMARAILDGHSLCQLGFAVPRQPVKGLWNRLWNRETLQIFELEDAPLLLSLQQCRLLDHKTSVLDANEELLGTVRKFARTRERRDCLGIYDPWGTQLAVACEEGHELLFRASDGSPIATVGVTNDVLRLSFAEVLHGNPPARLLLLAAILANNVLGDRCA